MNRLDEQAKHFGSEIVRCDAGCEGSSADLKSGILPRCLFFEKRSGSRGAVIVGLNPGNSDASERQFYQKHGATYEAVVEFWVQNNQKIGYYSKLRRLVDALEIQGPLWWTELAKCESIQKGVKLPIQSLRHCGGRFLRRELHEIPDNWPVFAIGGQAFQALSFLLPDRAVLGFPHPTGSFGHFSKLFKGGALNENTYLQARECLATSVPQARWFST